MSKHTTNPQELGWAYQGTNEQSRVSFYEKDGVKMDYYYTTGDAWHCSVVKLSRCVPSGASASLSKLPCLMC